MDWMDKNVIANFHLLLAISVLFSVAEKKTKEILDVLIKLYEIKSLHNRIFLKRGLYALRMSESTFVKNYINTLNMIFSQFTASNFNIVENERVEVLLQNLQYSYD